jgi:hypothetical protein
MRVRLDLAPGGSVFVVFRGERSPSIASVEGPDAAGTPSAGFVAGAGGATALRCWRGGEYVLGGADGNAKTLTVARLPEPRVLEGPWKVAFDPAWGAPAEVSFPELMSWTGHADEGVRHYSGTGTYRRALEVPADSFGAGRRILLDLGDVRELAEVLVNGKSAGILWKPPYRADVTDLVRPGANELKIEVMNLWINRLVADGKLPESERLTRTNIRQGQDWEAQPSGLLGPVRLMVAEDVPLE